MEDFIKNAKFLFEVKYNCSPEEYGYPVIDVYQRQRAYLYGKDEEAVKVYKKCQNLIRNSLMVGLMGCLALLFVFAAWCVFYSDKVIHPLSIGALAIGVVDFFGVLIAYFRRKKKKKKHRGKVIFLNY